MRFSALATDYDGTLAHGGHVSAETWKAVERLRASGRKVFLVTGRELDELRHVCPRLDLFDCVVAENGGLLYRPDTREEELLAPAPPQSFLRALHERRIAPISVGRTIVATWRPHEIEIAEILRDLALPMHVILNKDAVMVLPTGVDKATGLQAVLTELGLSPQQVVCIGDAENDGAFLALCGYAVAVANALPVLKERADSVTQGSHGQGVIELIDTLLNNELPNSSHLPYST